MFVARTPQGKLKNETVKTVKKQYSQCLTFLGMVAREKPEALDPYTM